MIHNPPATNSGARFLLENIRMQKREKNKNTGPHSGRNGESVLDLELDRLLERLPDAPLSSNFTARVLQSLPASREIRRTGWWTVWGGLSFSWKMAAASVCVGFVLIGQYRHQVAVRDEVARSVVAVGNLASFPTVEMMENFEAIRRLNDVTEGVDLELLAALQ